MANQGAKAKRKLPKNSAKKKTARKSPAPSPPPADPSGLYGMEKVLLDQCPQGIVAVDRKGTVRYVNPAAETLLDKKTGRMVGEKFSIPFDPKRPQEVSLPGRGRESRIAEVLTSEVKWGKEKIFVVCLNEVTDRVRTEEQLRALSDLDPLTGLLNRRGFLKATQRQLSLAVRKKWGMTLFFLDLDGLKNINDVHGHIEGDQALLQVASILLKTVREPDIIGRYAGDEFTILALETKRKKVAGDEIAGRLRQNLDAYNTRRPVSKKLSLSIGIAYFDPKKPVSIDELIDDADIKMYEEKRTKRRAQ
jgi:diguanylate cyclase (GGDEF)-like protein